MNRRYVRDEHKRKVKKQRGIIIFMICILLIAIVVIVLNFGINHEEKTKTLVKEKLSIDTDWNLVLVNRWNPIPDDYKVNLVRFKGGEKVDERIYEPLMEMMEAAEEEGFSPVLVSGYRTHNQQKRLYENKVKEYQREGYSESQARELAQQWVSVPGNSEHQLGLAVDINGDTYDIYLWLMENSYKYGFIFRYPGSKGDITGAAEEVWHYRYVGVEASTEMYEKDLCLEEYLKIKK